MKLRKASSHRPDGAVAGGIASGSRAGARFTRRRRGRLHASRSTDSAFSSPSRSSILRRTGPSGTVRRSAVPGPNFLKLPLGSAPAGKVCDGEIAVTMINHATLLIQMDGVNILTDPIWAERSVPDGRRQAPPAGGAPLRGPAEDRRRPRLAQPPGPHGPADAPPALAAAPARRSSSACAAASFSSARASGAGTISTGGSPRRSLPASRSRPFRRATTPTAASSTRTGRSGAASS